MSKQITPAQILQNGGIAPITTRTLASQAAAAFALRVLLGIAVCFISGQSLSWLAIQRDGSSYLAVARWLAGGPDPATFDLRVFSGIPLLLAPLFAAGLPVDLIALPICWVCAALVAPLCTLWSRRTAIGWAAVLLTPSWVMYSTQLTSEPALLALTLCALILARKSAVASGITFAAAGLMRPMACFATLGACFSLWLEGRQTKAVVMGAVALAGVVAASAVLHWTASYGLADISNYSRQYYGGDLLTWPGRSLLQTTATAPLWKTAYVWLHVLIVLWGCFCLARCAARSRAKLDCEAAVWLCSNTMFVLCVGNIWGFHEFHRFVLPALPALLLGYAGLLERANRWIWLCGLGLSFAASLFAILPH